MKFQYGISPESLARWATFKRICDLQAVRGPDVGGSLTRFIIDTELAAIERATVACEQREATVLQKKW